MAEIAGLKLIIPSSVTATGAGSSASVSATGKVTFTAAETVSINGCFNATYDNYLIVSNMLLDVDGAVLYRWRVGGSDASATNYIQQRLLGNNTSVTGARTTGANHGVFFWADNVYGGGVHMHVYQPAIAAPTVSRSATHYGSSLVAFLGDWVVSHSLSTAYDGVTFYEAGVNEMNGSITVYGLSQ